MFQSILFETIGDGAEKGTPEAPVFFAELSLDQVIDDITAGKQEYDLRPLFLTPLKDVNVVKYRQEIAKDLENGTLLENIKSFGQQMAVMRQYLAIVDKLENKHHKDGWFLETVEVYCAAVSCLIRDLSLADLKSRGLLALRAYLMHYAGSDRFTSIVTETKKLKGDLSGVKYCVAVRPKTITVRKYESELDYSPEVERTFAKFRQGAVKDYTVPRFTGSSMNHVEAGILDLVAKLYPDIFLHLNNYCAQYADYLDATIRLFDREIMFYVAYMEYIAVMKRAGLKFCYPQISVDSRDIYSYEGFDLAMARKCITENSPVVCNDFYLKGKERIFVISGPDQAGKTTFARTFGQLHYLAGLGCPVPGREARLFLCDTLYVHFEKEEHLKDLRSKLEDDLIRVCEILDQATSNSIVILDKILTSTTLKDASLLSKRLIDKLLQLDALCVWVTSVEELASFTETTVSMVSTVVPDNPALRTYKIVRSPANGLSYATSIAEKYRLTYDCLKERMKS